MRLWHFVIVGVFVGCSAVPGLCGERKGSAKQPVPPTLDVELYSAVDNRQVDVAVIAHSYSLVTLRVRNNTRNILKIKLPETFAAVPAARWNAWQLAQRRPGDRASKSMQFGFDQGGSQGLAGSLYGPWSGGQGQVGDKGNQAGEKAGEKAGNQAGEKAGQERQAPKGPGFWMIAPGEIFQTQMRGFCLEFGKPDPNRKIPYRLCRLDQLNSRPVVRELLGRFGQGGWDQRIAQLAVWHVANGVPWQTLAQVKLPRMPGRRPVHISRVELLAAKNLSESLPSYGGQQSLGNH